MTYAFLDLPLEIRIYIYKLVFGNSNVVLSATRRSDDSYSMLPAETTPLHNTQRSGQLLRVCRTIVEEARPVLYHNSEFHVVAQAFAGRLPCAITNGHPAMPYVQHLIWQLDCDLLKHLYYDELHLNCSIIAQMTSIEIRRRAETWRDSFMGYWCDCEAFVTGREQTIEFGKLLRDSMRSGSQDIVNLVEDRAQLGLGRVILRLERKERTLQDQEVLIT